MDNGRDFTGDFYCRHAALLDHFWLLVLNTQGNVLVFAWVKKVVSRCA